MIEWLLWALVLMFVGIYVMLIAIACDLAKIRDWLVKIHFELANPRRGR